jgi:hypothetical protein
MNPAAYSRRQSLFGLAAATTIAIGPGLGAEPQPESPILLTVGGLAGAPNRSGSVPSRDRLFDHNNIAFQKARSFSAQELSAMPYHSVRANIYGTEAVARGPRLAEIVTRASPLAGASTLRLFALDGYGAEIPITQALKQEWILAAEADGRAFEIGSFGPLFAMRQLGPDEKKSDEEDAKWVHSIYYIELAA